ncbi:MAG: hypothetical protein ACKO2G_04670 [Verrucomicrobiales bacterium]
MQITLRIRDDLYRAANAEAAREGISLASFLESAIRMRLRKPDHRNTGKPHAFLIYTPDQPLTLSNEGIKRAAEEEGFRYDLRKLGGETP